MLRKASLMDTLQQLEQVETNFQETLNTIDSIGQRYKLMSHLKRKSQQRQHWYEDEIQGAITEYAGSKISERSLHKERLGRTTKRFKKTKVIKIKKPTIKIIIINEQDRQSLRLEHNCTYEIQNTNTNASSSSCSRSRTRSRSQTPIKRSQIRRLSAEANRKLKQKAGKNSNRHVHDTELETDPDSKPCSSHCCCCSCHCNCEYCSLKFKCSQLAK